jgi:hypothetical protein
LKKLSPIALFVYNRLDHTRQTIEALQKNIFADQSQLFIFSDGPKTEAQVGNVKAVRELTKAVKGFERVHITEREQNLGLARSVISGVTELVEKYGKVIVLEDDMLTSPFFLQYMNEALDMYEKEESVISIHGYIYPVAEKLPETFFLKGADCWGWATWKRGWDLFETDAQKLLDELQDRKLTYSFDFNNSHPYTRMLKDQIEGKVDSWAIRWYASAFVKGRYTLYPGKSLVKNIGVDGSGMHCGSNENYLAEISNKKVKLKKIPIVTDQKAFQAVRIFFKPELKKESQKEHRVKKIFRKLFNL